MDRHLRFVGELNDDDARAIANDLVSQAVFTIWRAHPFTEFVLPVDVTFSTVVGSPFYVLPTYFGRIASKEGIVRNLSTGAKIYPITGRDLEELFPALGSALDQTPGPPTRYTISGKVGVSVQVAAAGEALEAVSSDAADTDIQLTIEGVDSTGEWTTTQVLLTGNAAKALGTWRYVQQVGKSYQLAFTPATALTSSRGTITVRTVAGAATRLILLAHEASREQWQLRLQPAPATVETIAVPTIRLPRRIFQDADPLPADWGDAIDEELRIQWRVNTSEITEAEANGLARPKLLQLIGLDNERKPAVRPRKRPFGGW